MDRFQGWNCVGLGGAGGKPTGPREKGMATGWEIAGGGGLVNCVGLGGKTSGGCEIGMGAGPARGEIAGVIFNAWVGGAGRACRAGKVGSAGGRSEEHTS